MGDICRTACAALLLAMLLTGCSGTERSEPDSKPEPEPRSRTTSPAELCAQNVAHWTKDQLRPDGGEQSDYQQKGLSDGENTLVLQLVGQARKIRERDGRRAAHLYVDREARDRCAQRHTESGGSPAPSGGWPR